MTIAHNPRQYCQCAGRAGRAGRHPPGHLADIHLADIEVAVLADIEVAVRADIHLADIEVAVLAVLAGHQASDIANCCSAAWGGGRAERQGHRSG